MREESDYQEKTLASGLDLLNLSPHLMILEVVGTIDERYASLTPVLHLHIQFQRPSQAAVERISAHIQ